jgi:hypothetical protein
MSFQAAAIECAQLQVKPEAPSFSAEYRKDYISIASDRCLFSTTPYVAVKNIDSGNILHVNPTPNGSHNWAIQEVLLPERFIMGVAGFSTSGKQSVYRYMGDGETLTLLEKDLKDVIPFI